MKKRKNSISESAGEGGRGSYCAIRALILTKRKAIPVMSLGRKGWSEPQAEEEQCGKIS